MITREEIERKAQEFEIHVANVERDYVFGWFIFGLFSISSLKEEIFLKGGNALRKGYFEQTRFSSDLDFGIPGDIDQDVLLKEINNVCDFIQEKAEVNFINEENKVDEKFSATDAPTPGLKVYEAKIYFKDFYGKKDHLRLKISMDITRFDKVLLPIQTLDLIHPYSDQEQLRCKIRCMKLEEIISTKLKCLLQRQHAPDLFDYAYAIKLLGASLNKEEVVDTFIKKTIFERNPHTVKEILLATPFDYFRKYWSKSIVCAKQFLFDVEEAISAFNNDLEQLFSSYPDNGFKDFVYFPASLRVPIMEAGREQTLIRIRYKGSDRMIEPYSLKYLEKKGGTRREYFYAYNLSGGDSPPSIRCFLPDRVEAIENTNEKFQPRYSIELSKAGEKPENPYLFDPNRPAPVRAVRTRHARSGIIYVYKCSSCGKVFYKSTEKGTLKPHKSSSGYYCSGQGYYVTTKY